MSSPFDPGQLLAGKFRVERVLGRGGMGVVVAARHLHLDELVAIKFLVPEAVANREAVARFEREARAAVKIKSEHISRVSDVGVFDWGAPYMVMEYLHGQDLGQLVRERGPLSLDDALDYLLQACEAIAEAHALGIVHRDLKPANLFLTHRVDGSPCIKVLDFGISKVTSLSGSGGAPDALSMTRTATVMGSPLYMSPEQLSSARDVDMATDVWALGVILFELLTGRVPFQAETLPQLCITIMEQPPAMLADSRQDLPAGLQDVVSACLEKDRRQRIPTVAALTSRLAEFAPKRARLSIERITRVSEAAGLSASSLSLSTSSVGENAHANTLAEFGTTTRPGPSGTWWVVAGATALAAASVAAYFFLKAPRAGPAVAERASAAPHVAAAAPAAEAEKDRARPAEREPVVEVTARPAASASAPPSPRVAAAPTVEATATRSIPTRAPVSTRATSSPRAPAASATSNPKHRSEWGGRL